MSDNQGIAPPTYDEAVSGVGVRGAAEPTGRYDAMLRRLERSSTHATSVIERAERLMAALNAPEEAGAADVVESSSSTGSVSANTSPGSSDGDRRAAATAMLNAELDRAHQLDREWAEQMRGVPRRADATPPPPPPPANQEPMAAAPLGNGLTAEFEAEFRQLRQAYQTWAQENMPHRAAGLTAELEAQLLQFCQLRQHFAQEAVQHRAAQVAAQAADQGMRAAPPGNDLVANRQLHLQQQRNLAALQQRTAQMAAAPPGNGLAISPTLAAAMNAQIRRHFERLTRQQQAAQIAQGIQVLGHGAGQLVAASVSAEFQQSMQPRHQAAAPRQHGHQAYHPYLQGAGAAVPMPPGRPSYEEVVAENTQMRREIAGLRHIIDGYQMMYDNKP